ncbi:MAG TPA: antitoxin [archaeon]|nr:antitoxin [archaeon]
MAQALIILNENQDRVVTIVKGKYGLKNKSQAVGLIVDKFEEALLEPELRPEYKEELLKIDRGKFRAFSGVEALRRELANV